MTKLPSLQVQAGYHSRHFSVCWAKLPERVELPRDVRLVSAKVCHEGQIVITPDGSYLGFVLDRLPAGRQKTLTVEPDDSARPLVALRDTHGRIDVSIDDDPFTSYHYSAEVARPYLYPVLGPGGVSLTRTIEKSGAPGYDHPHHRSVWISHGLINGTDNWSEDPGHGRTAHREFASVESGPVMGTIVEYCDWVTASGARIMGDRRIIRFYALPEGARCVDFTCKLSTGHDAVLFGDTKEGGMLSVRVNPQIEAPAGTIENSFGGVSEDETWGKRAHWCDYSGTIDGVPAGIAILDHPANYGHPVYWHVRNYGLMTANPFGVSYFEPGSGKRGDWVLGANSEVTFRYRLYIHEGDVRKGRVAEAYRDYVSPPVCQWVE